MMKKHVFIMKINKTVILVRLQFFYIENDENFENQEMIEMLEDIREKVLLIDINKQKYSGKCEIISNENLFLIQSFLEKKEKMYDSAFF